MLNTAKTIYVVPGEGLRIEIGISAEEITIVPCIDRNGDKTSEFSKTTFRTWYSFRPEAYKRFWRWISNSEEEAYVRHGDRMRKALGFALRKYRAAYGEIFN